MFDVWNDELKFLHIPKLVVPTGTLNNDFFSSVFPAVDFLAPPAKTLAPRILQVLLL
jgi:hypothetical protein